MPEDAGIIVAKGRRLLALQPRLANRHGLIAGATGTGKTVSLQVLAEGFSERGVPVFVADVKGDLAGLSQAGQATPRLTERMTALGLADHRFRAYPTVFWDLSGERGHPVRATVSDLGPLLFARLLGLNDIQGGVLNLVFKVADDEGLLLLDLKDLQALLGFVADNAARLKTRYGNVSAASIGAIQRGLLQLEQQGGDRFFGEPALALEDLMLIDPSGRGAINVLVADRLMQSPVLYATFLMWLMAELFENLPEVGDLDKPKLVFFFDEAHLLFDGAPKALVDKVEQVVRLIRSKGVGIYFITQNPLDVPDAILGQLGNRIQHALRAFTPRDQKAVRAAAETFRNNPELDTAKAIAELGVGEALVSLLDPAGTPGIVERAHVLPPCSRLGPITGEERAAIMAASPVKDTYDRPVDRESAYEKLTRRVEPPAVPTSPEPIATGAWRRAGKTRPPPAPRSPRAAPPAGGGGGLADLLLGGGSSRREGLGEAMAKSVARSIGTQVGRQIVRGILGSLLK